MKERKYKVKFFGSKKLRGQIIFQKTIVTATSVDNVESVLNRLGWVKINGLKISECNEG